jgi:hypothetical protein
MDQINLRNIQSASNALFLNVGYARFKRVLLKLVTFVTKVTISAQIRLPVLDKVGQQL